MPLIKAIPKIYRNGFQRLSEIDENHFTKMTDALEFFPWNSSLMVLIKKINDLTKLSIEDLQNIFFSVGSLISYIDSEKSLAEIVEDIFNVGIEEGLISKEVTNFKSRLTYLLKDKHIYYASKGNSLKTEFGNVVINTKIITDVRPVFDIELDGAPKSALIIHNLHIHYQSDEEAYHKDIFLALDSNDLKELKSAIDRATQKENSLKVMLEKAEVINLGE